MWIQMWQFLLRDIGWLIFIYGLSLISLIFLGHYHGHFKRGLSRYHITFFSCVLIDLGSRLLFSKYEFVRGIWQLCFLVYGISIIALCSRVLFALIVLAFKSPIQSIVQDVFIVCASLVFIFIRMRHMGVDLASLVTTSAVLTATIGLALKDVLSNILGGLTLQIEHTLKIGEWIKLDKHSGKVIQVNWRHTLIETIDKETIVIPNQLITNSVIVVLGQKHLGQKYYKQTITFAVDYRFSPMRVIDTVETALRSASILHVAKSPKPRCFFQQYQDNIGRYELIYSSTQLEDSERIASHVRAHLYFALKRAEMDIILPVSHSFLLEEKKQEQQRQYQLELHLRLQTLQRIELFKSLNETEYRLLAERLKLTPFLKGDTITKQGSITHWLYLIIQGQANVYLEGQEGSQKQVALLKEGDFFGEMSLLTGAPRRATVVAHTDIECFRLDKESFLDIVKSRPELAEALARVLAKRTTELASAQQDLNSEEKTKRMNHAERDFLDKIRDFFHLD